MAERRTATITVTLDENEHPNTMHEVARIALTCDDGPLEPQDFTNVRERTENLIAALEEARQEHSDGHVSECGQRIDDAFGIAGEILDLAKTREDARQDFARRCERGY